jgi:hypothetical protein
VEAKERGGQAEASTEDGTKAGATSDGAVGARFTASQVTAAADSSPTNGRCTVTVVVL